jgi:NTP pyrophosphatase (non-canonical NTP hydrolase)
MNLIVHPTTDLYTTSAPPDGMAPRPPGEGWSLAGLEVSHRNTSAEIDALCVVYFWTRSHVYAEAETGAPVEKKSKVLGSPIAAARALANGATLSEAVQAVSTAREPGKMTRDEILASAINAWGTRSQVNMAIEECGELIVALCHRLRGRCDDNYVAEEIADVQIMLDQLSLIVGKDLVRNFEEQKLERLALRVRASAEPALDHGKFVEALYREYDENGEPKPPEFVRASKDSVCETCNLPYWKHPFSEHLGNAGPFLRRLCGGKLVKL